MARARSSYTVNGETFTPLPGNARNFVDSRGNLYSRRQVDAIRSGRKEPTVARTLIATPAAKQARRAKAGGYKFAVNAWKKAESKRTGVPVNKIKVRGNSEQAKRFQAEWAKIQQSPDKAKTFSEFLRSLPDIGDAGGRSYVSLIERMFETSEDLEDTL